MSCSYDSNCPKCRKPYYDKYQSRYDRHSKCDRFICDDRFKVRLGGLQSGLNFRLRQLIDCEVKLTVECGGECEEVIAKICFVGSDYVEIRKVDSDPGDECEVNKKDTFIIPIKNISGIKVNNCCRCDCDCNCK
ncbi:hypothetical protein [Guptibacillus hwajinpoensis]|uniref:hypothetical protein n=1 Tax=Guptibacillus hwajinpoensis TaxID=208199 RepID=UPI003735DAF8